MRNIIFDQLSEVSKGYIKLLKENHIFKTVKIFDDMILMQNDASKSANYLRIFLENGMVNCEYKIGLETSYELKRLILSCIQSICLDFIES